MKSLLLTIVAIVLLSSPASSGETIKLCGAHWPPFTYSENGLLTKGITIDIFKEAFGRLQMEFQADEIPWPRCVFYTEKGTYAAAIDGPGRDSLISGIPTNKYLIAVYVRHDFPEDTFSWERMKGKTIGMISGYLYTDNITQFDKWKIDWSKTESMMMKKLHAGHYDYGLLDPLTVPSLEQELGFKVKMLTPIIATMPLYLLFSKHKADLAKRFDSVVQEMIQDGKLDEIYKKHGPYSYTDLMNMKSD